MQEKLISLWLSSRVIFEVCLVLNFMHGIVEDWFNVGRVSASCYKSLEEEFYKVHEALIVAILSLIMMY